jgi:SAM-dependent methyltransferase
MSLRFHEIAEARHRILDPIDASKLRLVGQICELTPDSSVIDLCCGKAEMLAQWYEDHGISGTGVDLSGVFVAAARERLDGLGAGDRIEIVQAEAADWARAEAQRRDNAQRWPAHVVSCVGATWIGGGFAGTLELMRPLVQPDGLVVVGECHLRHGAPEHLAPPGALDDFQPLATLLDVVEAQELELVEMVVSTTDEWDRYVASQWNTVHQYLAAHPDDPDADALRAWNAEARRRYVTWERDSIGWGVLVMRQRRPAAAAATGPS